MRPLGLAGLLLLATLVAGALWKSLPARTAPRDGPAPIARLVSAEIGGIRQWLLIRGADRTAPILLWLHGGPGAAQMPVHAITAGLERHAVVVHWDQRGAGKSNPPGFDPATMTLERFLADAREVTAFLRAEVGPQPIVVPGHSWGTMLGARLVARWPEEYAGYVAVSQQVDTLRGAILARDWLRVVTPGSELAALPAEAFRDHDTYVRLMQAVEAHGGGMGVPLAALLPRVLAAPEYRLPDYPRWLEGANRGSGPMWPDYVARDLIAEVPRLPVPMLVIAGARDRNTPLALVREWLARLEAPHGKRLVLFEGSGHAPFLTETERFVTTLAAFLDTVRDPP